MNSLPYEISVAKVEGKAVFTARAKFFHSLEGLAVGSKTGIYTPVGPAIEREIQHRVGQDVIYWHPRGTLEQALNTPYDSNGTSGLDGEKQCILFSGNRNLVPAVRSAAMPKGIGRNLDNELVFLLYAANMLSEVVGEDFVFPSSVKDEALKGALVLEPQK